MPRLLGKWLILGMGQRTTWEDLGIYRTMVDGTARHPHPHSFLCSIYRGLVPELAKQTGGVTRRRPCPYDTYSPATQGGIF